MKNELRGSVHTMGESNLHLQFTPAFRRDIFCDPLVRELTVAYVVLRAKKLCVDVAAIECGPDHLHIFVREWKRWSIAMLVGQLKTYSSRMMRKGHQYLFDDKLWGKKFWSAGYFYRTVGEVTADTVKKYVQEGQKKHWEAREEKTQQTLFNYSSQTSPT